MVNNIIPDKCKYNIEYMDHITRQYAKDHPTTLFIFGDNDLRQG